MSAICLVCVIANYMELNFSVKIVLDQSLSIACVLYYLCIMLEFYNRDLLTEVFNRRRFFMDVEKKKNKRLAIVLFEINELKKINEKRGQENGDLAVLACTKNFIKVFKNSGTVYRLTGDEFAVLIKDKNICKIDDYLKKFADIFERTKYSISVGYRIHEPGENIEDIVDVVDSKEIDNKCLIQGCLFR